MHARMNQVAPPQLQRMPVAMSSSARHDVAHDVGLGSGSPADVGDDPRGAAAHLKKERRNERDRRRSHLKRESMDKMRATVARLEAQKRKLLALLPPTEDKTAETKDKGDDAREPEPPASPVGDDDSPVPRRQQFVRLAAEIEALRAANAALAGQLRERDMFSSAAQNLMLEFDRAEDLTALLDVDDGDIDLANDGIDGHRPTGEVAFTPLTMDEAQATVRATLQQMASARAVHLRDEAGGERGAKFFGWSEYTYRKQTTISFALKKLLPNTVPRALLAATWGFITDSSSTAKLIRPQLSATYTPLQMLGPNMLVIDRRTEDQCRVGVGNQMLAMRTVYLLFWTREPASTDANGDADANGEEAYVLAMKTIDLPLVKRLLRPDEVWCDIFYWIRFAADGRVLGDSEGGTSATLAEFGGVNTYVREEIASSWLAELVFLAIRWETLAVAPCLLKN